MRVVTIDSTHEEVAASCRDYRQAQVFPVLTGEGLTLQQFDGPQSSRASVAPALTAADVNYVTASGHGFENRFTGQDGLSLFEIGQYAPAEVHGKIIHLLACLTGQELGADLVAKGCAAFFGYDVVFVFPLGQPELFLECDAEIDRSLAAGKTCEDAYEDAFNAFTVRIEQLMALKKPYLAAALAFNRDRLCAPSVDAKFGSKSARVAK